MKKLVNTLILNFIGILLGIFIIYSIFNPIFNAKSLIFPYAVHPFDICKLYPRIWCIIKISYISVFLISYNIFSFKILKKINLKKIIKENKLRTQEKLVVADSENLSLKVGINQSNRVIKIEEEGLYQNIFITGTIGSGKTSSAMYPFTKQLMEYKADNTKEKLAILILDVKGNYSQKVLEFANQCERLEDVVVIDLLGKWKYNPLDKPEIKEAVLANRLKTILTLFNKNNAESYWLDKRRANYNRMH